jgi:hypothetical protein
MDENGDGAQSPKTRQQVEIELLEALRHHQMEWIASSDGNRDIARQRFMNALHAFNSFVLYNKPPDDPKKS